MPGNCLSTMSLHAWELPVNNIITYLRLSLKMSRPPKYCQCHLKRGNFITKKQFECYYMSLKARCCVTNMLHDSRTSRRVIVTTMLTRSHSNNAQLEFGNITQRIDSEKGHPFHCLQPRGIDFYECSPGLSHALS